jgi:hypothetical protein
MIKKNVPLILGGSGASLRLLREAFPALPWLELPAYGFQYPKKASGMGFALLSQLPHLWRVRQAEKALLAKLVQSGRVGGVISDHRYGMFHPDIPSRLLAHQLCPQVPGSFLALAPFFHLFHRQLLMGFSGIWVPDHIGSPLSGVLSSGMKADGRLRFIGPLSRFEGLQASKEKRYAMGFLLSGPEPQRSIVEDRILAQLDTSPYPVLLIRGLPGADELPALPPEVEVHSHLPPEDLFRKLSQCRRLLCRPGYSSGMDLCHIDVPVCFVPTPGQTEQEYLAQHWAKQWGIPFVSQNRFSVAEVMAAPSAGMCGALEGGQNEFERAMEEFLGEVRKNADF